MAEQIVTEVEYRDIPGFEGYRVGSDGSVWTCWRKESTGLCGLYMAMSDTWKKMKPRKVKNGYLRVKIAKKTFPVHRLVLLAFTGPRPEGHEVRHLDGSRDNNHKSNLAWGTHIENMQDRDAHGTTASNKGTSNGAAKLTDEKVLLIREKHSQGESMSSLGRQFGVCVQAVSNIVYRKVWKHVA